MRVDHWWSANNDKRASVREPSAPNAQREVSDSSRGADFPGVNRSMSDLAMMRQPLFAVDSEMLGVIPKKCVGPATPIRLTKQGACSPGLLATRERIGYLTCTFRIANLFGEQPTARVNAVLKALEE